MQQFMDNKNNLLDLIIRALFESSKIGHFNQLPLPLTHHPAGLLKGELSHEFKFEIGLADF